MAAEQGAANRNPDPRFNQPHTEELLGTELTGIAQGSGRMVSVEVVFKCF